MECKVNVVNGPKFTDFSKAKYELLFDTNTDLKISGINPSDTNYYFVITKDKTRPNIPISKYGGVDTEKAKNIDYLNINENKKYLYKTYIDKYVELNQDLYLWVIQDEKLDASYYLDENNYHTYSTKFVVEGEKLTRPELPLLNQILRSFDIGGYKGKTKTEAYTYMNFRFPTETKNRKFTVKIGKITDNNILRKIQKNDYSGITDLLKYAKSNKAVYTENLKTTNPGYYSTNKALFNGYNMLESGSYYYIYVKFDDENGKYYPIETVTMGQAWKSDLSNNNWHLYAYNSDKFKWNNLSSSSSDDKKEKTETTSKTKKDTTVAKKKLPYTGSRIIIISSIMVLIVSVVATKIMKDKYKEI